MPHMVNNSSRYGGFSTFPLCMSGMLAICRVVLVGILSGIILQVITICLQHHVFCHNFGDR